MAETTKRRTPEEKLAECKEAARMGLEEMSLELNQRAPYLTQKESREIVDALFGIIQETLKSGRNVIIRGFGSFQCRERKARRIHNPRAAVGDANEWGEVGASTAFRFKPGREMKPVFHDKK